MEHNFIENELVILTKQTLDIFLQQENPSELIALYTFYYYTAKWQQTNQIKCTTEYVAKGLHWNKHKVVRVKKQLLEFGLIEDARIVDEATKKVTGYYIKMNYIFKKTTLNESQCAQNPPTGFEAPKNEKASVPKIDPLENEHTNALSTNNLNALSTGNNIFYVGNKKTSPEKEQKNGKRFHPPTVEEVKAYCKERKNKIDPEKFVAYYESNGWCVGKSKMKDWQASVRFWEKNDNQKQQSNQQTSYNSNAYDDISQDDVFSTLYGNE